MAPVARGAGNVDVADSVAVESAVYVFKLFDEAGNLLDAAFVKRTEKFLNELIWMAATLRYGRENIPLK